MTAGSDARTALLEAALEELAEHGASGTGLRAVARRAGLSHAAPGYFFGDRAGMLTALAVRGFVGLAEVLERLGPAARPERLAALGNAYLDFGLSNGPLFDLMFSSEVVQSSDADLADARRRALAPLLAATRGDADSDQDALMSWGLVHGLTTLVRQGALPSGGTDAPDVRGLINRFASLTSARAR
jgi:AcrR family transcriptional regulator